LATKNAYALIYMFSENKDQMVETNKINLIKNVYINVYTWLYIKLYIKLYIYFKLELLPSFLSMEIRIGIRISV